jgi:hypothetical protein
MSSKTTSHKSYFFFNLTLSKIDVFLHLTEEVIACAINKT